MHKSLEFSGAGVDLSTKLTDQVSLADSLLAIAKSAKPTAIASQANSPQSAKPTAPVGYTDSPMTSTVNEHDKLSNRPGKLPVMLELICMIGGLLY
jgi:hypothetical protein